MRSVRNLISCEDKMMSVRTTALEQLNQVREMQGIQNSPGEWSRWSFEFAGRTLSLPNFGWRKAAIDTHDLHHLILGESFTFSGECQVATWEFAAGAFPDLRAQIFCLPLVAFGAVTAPKKTWKSFRNGCRQKSLYRSPVDHAATLEELSALVSEARAGDHMTLAQTWFKYGILLSASAALYLIPFVLLGIVWAGFWH